MLGRRRQRLVEAEYFVSGDATSYAPVAELYPTHEDYVDAVTEAADAAVEDGFLLDDDRDAIVAEADAALVPD